MKLCPQCRTPYTDSSLNYCLKDGVALIEDIPSGYTSKVDTLKFPGAPLDKVVCPDKWLHEIAEWDKRNIGRCVVVVQSLTGANGLKAGAPYLDFTFSIFNGSVYVITIDEKIEGSILLHGEPLSGALKVLGSGLENIQHSERRNLLIRQWVNKEEAELIRNLSGESEAIYFNGLRVIVKGSHNFQEVQEGQIYLPLPRLDRFNSIRAQSSERTVELAQGDDVFTIHYNYDVLEYIVDDENLLGRFADELSVTWADIFMAISPYMLDGISNASIKHRLEEFVEERVYPDIKSQHESNVDAVSFQIIDSDIQTIKIQLRTLGLIIQSQREGVDWALTPHGDKQMTNLRAIKRTLLQA